MLNIDNILSFYPKKLHIFKENIIKEYLQYKILDIVYSTKYSPKLIFLGGTCIRMVHNSPRFSEDLDFDNRNLSETDFENISNIIKHKLELDGYMVEIKNVYKSAYHCYIKFPRILYQTKLSGHKTEKILIQLDAEPQKFNYKSETHLINKFEIFRYINITPSDVLLSQKICAILTRKREKGRDFFDIIYLMAKTEPNYHYLKEKLNIDSKEQLIKRLKNKSEKLNFRQLSKDIEPFLFDPTQKNRVLHFEDWLQTLR